MKSAPSWVATPSRRRRNRVTRAAMVGGLALTAIWCSTSALPANAAPPGQCGPNNRFGPFLPSVAPSAFPGADLTNVANFITETNHVEAVPRSKRESQDESDIEAGYTYVGQFIDHDITLDPRPDNFTGSVDPSTLVNARSPQLDLDSVYGRGPAGSRSSMRPTVMFNSVRHRPARSPTRRPAMCSGPRTVRRCWVTTATTRTRSSPAFTRS